MVFSQSIHFCNCLKSGLVHNYFCSKKSFLFTRTHTPHPFLSASLTTHSYCGGVERHRLGSLIVPLDSVSTLRAGVNWASSLRRHPRRSLLFAHCGRRNQINVRNLRQSGSVRLNRIFLISLCI